jgi:hypothetical protein
MPTIGHALLGGSIALILYTISQKWNTEKKFTERMVIIFAFNSMIGPDIFTMLNAFRLGEVANSIPIRATVHSVLGWPLWCLIIMWLWYYVINIRSTEKTKLSMKATLLLLIAAGEMHFFLDTLDAGMYIFGYGDLSIRVTLQDLFLIDDIYTVGPLTNVLPWFSMGEMFLVGLLFMIVLIYTIFRKQLIYTYITAGIFLTSIVILYFLLGSNILGGSEHDIGVTLYFGGLFIIPLGLMVLAME